ncbi:DedA family protein [Phormidesmis priestleyi]
MNFDAAHLGQWIQQVGPIVGHLVIWAIVFAESGLLIGFFLPGDSLLFTAGFLASQDILNIGILTLGCFVAAVLGDSVGYVTGNRFGRKLFNREDSWLFHKKHLVSAQGFYEKYGKKAIVLARFVPVVRTFAPIVAGIGAMNYRTFLSYNVIGGLLWTFGVTLLGYSLGAMIPDVDKYLLPIILIIIVVSLLPSVFHIYQERKSSRH